VKRTLLALLALAVLSLLLRAGHMVFKANPHDWFGTEPERVAASLARGHGFCDPFAAPTGPTAHVSPGYPLLLSSLYRAFGTYETTVGRTAQQFLSIGLATIAVLLLPIVANRLGLAPRAGWLAALLVALGAAQPAREVTGHHELVLASVQILLVLLTMARWHAQHWRGMAIPVLLGLQVALLALVCPSLLAGPILFLLAAWWTASREERPVVLRGTLLVGALCLVGLIPWTVRNCRALGGFVPLRSNLGLELAIGNHDEATGLTYNPGIAVHPFSNLRACAHLLEVGELTFMKEHQTRALAWIASHPGRFARLSVRRACLFWFGPCDSFWRLSGRRPINSLLDRLLGLAALVELVRLAWRRQPAAWLLGGTLVGATLPYLVTHVELRYRLPVSGLFLLLGCNLSLALVERLRARPRSCTGPVTVRQAA
jgi:hypothetical protein